jgi:hypothetical protein
MIPKMGRRTRSGRQIEIWLPIARDRHHLSERREDAAAGHPRPRRARNDSWRAR